MLRNQGKRKKINGSLPPSKSKAPGFRRGGKASSSDDKGKASPKATYSSQGRSQRPSPEEVSDIDAGLNLFGRNSVLEALESGKTIDKLLIKKGEIEGTLRVIVAKAQEAKIVVTEVSKHRLDELAQGESHQGVVALCPAYEYAEVSDILAKAKQKGQPPFIVILDNITDPHNLGAIIRTAECCGAHGVIIPKRRAASMTAVVNKASAGACEHVLVSRVNNITNVITTLKSERIWIACADNKGKNVFNEKLVSKTDGIAIVIGSEGYGVSRLVADACDFTVKIPMFGKLSSLNASVAAGVIMYEVVRQRESILWD